MPGQPARALRPLGHPRRSHSTAIDADFGVVTSLQQDILCPGSGPEAAFLAQVAQPLPVASLRRSGAP